MRSAVSSLSDIRWVQQRLGRVHPDLKQMVGKADGRMGPQTRQALCVYRTIAKGLPSSLWKPIGKADLTSLARARTLPGFAFEKQTHAKTVAWVSKHCQAVLEVVHGRYRHIMPATTGKPATRRREVHKQPSSHGCIRLYPSDASSSTPTCGPHPGLGERQVPLPVLG